ncbi:4-(cytidine 5'-diphospho)-2-C-methyl-D-erythritol kinase [Anditalea andensis]|uniref:4-diphosphocytidyl-2-C-methyl-D-erythritol kinase n=1 Tax=Anditalea andensis TaxID=1048983 RepID=A0A074LM38_9BACT|nr:4-(cytidine 5'-diphospho)-2-C-methyl-D-erythritol kinase [Anditalea andensis]KEO74952.1 4-diphosphocytidyl-2C-methyl-D-erythritol kinase [Anditalea andensis]
MILFPNAKINLGLHVKAKRKDGYHEIETCMYPIPLFDALEMIIDKKTTFNASGLPIPGNEKDNLIFKALKLIRKDFNELPHVNIHLHKKIPMGAGLGGGSADGAFALKLYNNLFDLYLEDWFLEDYAAQLGSDCPFFIENTPKIASGRGEILEVTDVDLKGKWIMLVNPMLHIGTKEAYAGLTPQDPAKSLKEILPDTSLWREYLVNDFEQSIFKIHPQLDKLKTQLYHKGAFYAAMSGSGSTIYGLYDEEPETGGLDEGYWVFKAEMK